MKQDSKPYKRSIRGYWLNPRFQMPFLLFHLWPFFALLFSILIFSTQQQIFLAALGIFIVSIPVGILFSHRIAGPVYRINKQLQNDVKAQNMNLVTFRKKDFFPELAGSYNALCLSLKKAPPKQNSN